MVSNGASTCYEKGPKSSVLLISDDAHVHLSVIISSNVIRFIANSAEATDAKHAGIQFGASVWRGFCGINNILFVRAARGGAVAPTDIPQFPAVTICDMVYRPSTISLIAIACAWNCGKWFLEFRFVNKPTRLCTKSMEEKGGQSEKWIFFNVLYL